MQVVHSYHYTISSLSGRQYYNQYYKVNYFSLNIWFTYMYFKIKMLIGKRNLPTREWCIIPFLLCCVSFPSLLPFPVKSCKKFKADEVYCWRKKLFLKKKTKKLLFCPSTQERLLNYKSSARKKQERHHLHVPYYVFYF